MRFKALKDLRQKSFFRKSAPFSLQFFDTARFSAAVRTIINAASPFKGERQLWHTSAFRWGGESAYYADCENAVLQLLQIPFNSSRIPSRLKKNYPSWRRDLNLGLSDLRKAPQGPKIGDPQKMNTLQGRPFPSLGRFFNSGGDCKENGVLIIRNFGFAAGAGPPAVSNI